MFESFVILDAMVLAALSQKTDSPKDAQGAEESGVSPHSSQLLVNQLSYRET